MLLYDCKGFHPIKEKKKEKKGRHTKNVYRRVSQSLYDVRSDTKHGNWIKDYGVSQSYAAIFQIIRK